MMDRHTCKLCFRRFANGRALGGHMRSHVTAAGKPKLPDTSPSPSSSSSASQGEHQVAERDAEVADQAASAEAEAEAEAAPAALVAGGEEAAGAEEAKQLACYGLRENPRKSYRLVDPEFSSTFVSAIAGEHAAGVGSSVVLQDRESETESSKPPPLLRRRSTRRRRPTSQLPPAPPKPEPSMEPEPVSSVSDTTPEEDVARCLMLLSRDVWTTHSSTAVKRKKPQRGEVGEGEGEGEGQHLSDGSEEEEEPAAAVRSRRGGRRRHQCGTCGKVFRSYQALGGHRASHKSARPCTAPPVPTTPAGSEEDGEGYDVRHPGHRIQDTDSEVNASPATGDADRRRVHECPVCFRVFASGQALGGHKRSHLAYSTITTNPSLLTSSNAAAARVVAATTVATTAAAAAGGGGGGSSVDVSFTKKLAGESWIDLNLPAPMDEEVEMSVVSDWEQ